MDIDLYRRAFVEAFLEAIRSPGMVAAFEQYRKIMSDVSAHGTDLGF
jgi:hypothetical protein